MNFLTHFLVNIILSVPLKYFFGLEWTTILLFIVASVLIDVDHIIYLVLKHKTINPKKLIAIGLEMRKRMQPGLYVFHSPEFNTALVIYAFYNPLALIILLSNMIHITLDIIEHYKHYNNLTWIKKWSIINSIIKI